MSGEIEIEQPGEELDELSAEGERLQSEKRLLDKLFIERKAESLKTVIDAYSSQKAKLYLIGKNTDHLTQISKVASRDPSHVTLSETQLVYAGMGDFAKLFSGPKMAPKQTNQLQQSTKTGIVPFTRVGTISAVRYMKLDQQKMRESRKVAAISNGIVQKMSMRITQSKIMKIVHGGTMIVVCVGSVASSLGFLPVFIATPILLIAGNYFWMRMAYRGVTVFQKVTEDIVTQMRNNPERSLAPIFATAITKGTLELTFYAAIEALSQYVLGYATTGATDWLAGFSASSLGGSVSEAFQALTKKATEDVTESVSHGLVAEGVASAIQTWAMYSSMAFKNAAGQRIEQYALKYATDTKTYTGKWLANTSVGKLLTQNDQMPFVVNGTTQEAEIAKIAYYAAKRKIETEETLAVWREISNRERVLGMEPLTDIVSDKRWWLGFKTRAWFGWKLKLAGYDLKRLFKGTGREKIDIITHLFTSVGGLAATTFTTVITSFFLTSVQNFQKTVTQGGMLSISKETWTGAMTNIHTRLIAGGLSVGFNYLKVFTIPAYVRQSVDGIMSWIWSLMYPQLESFGNKHSGMRDKFSECYRKMMEYRVLWLLSWIVTSIAISGKDTMLSFINISNFPLYAKKLEERLANVPLDEVKDVDLAKGASLKPTKEDEEVSKPTTKQKKESDKGKTADDLPTVENYGQNFSKVPESVWHESTGDSMTTGADDDENERRKETPMPGYQSLDRTTYKANKDEYEHTEQRLNTCTTKRAYKHKTDREEKATLKFQKQEEEGTQAHGEHVSDPDLLSGGDIPDPELEGFTAAFIALSEDIMTLKLGSVIKRQDELLKKLDQCKAAIGSKMEKLESDRARLQALKMSYNILVDALETGDIEYLSRFSPNSAYANILRTQLSMIDSMVEASGIYPNVNTSYMTKPDTVKFVEKINDFANSGYIPKSVASECMLYLTQHPQYVEIHASVDGYKGDGWTDLQGNSPRDEIGELAHVEEEPAVPNSRAAETAAYISDLVCEHFLGFVDSGDQTVVEQIFVKPTSSLTEKVLPTIKIDSETNSASTPIYQSTEDARREAKTETSFATADPKAESFSGTKIDAATLSQVNPTMFLDMLWNISGCLACALDIISEEEASMKTGSEHLLRYIFTQKVGEGVLESIQTMAGKLADKAPSMKDAKDMMEDKLLPRLSGSLSNVAYEYLPFMFPRALDIKAYNRPVGEEITVPENSRIPQAPSETGDVEEAKYPPNIQPESRSPLSENEVTFYHPTQINTSIVDRSISNMTTWETAFSWDNFFSDNQINGQTADARARGARRLFEGGLWHYEKKATELTDAEQLEARVNVKPPPDESISYGTKQDTLEDREVSLKGATSVHLENLQTEKSILSRVFDEMQSSIYSSYVFSGGLQNQVVNSSLTFFGMPLYLVMTGLENSKESWINFSNAVSNTKITTSLSSWAKPEGEDVSISSEDEKKMASFVNHMTTGGSSHTEFTGGVPFGSSNDPVSNSNKKIQDTNDATELSTSNLTQAQNSTNDEGTVVYAGEDGPVLNIPGTGYLSKFIGNIKSHIAWRDEFSQKVAETHEKMTSTNIPTVSIYESLSDKLSITRVTEMFEVISQMYNERQGVKEQKEKLEREKELLKLEKEQIETEKETLGKEGGIPKAAVPEKGKEEEEETETEEEEEEEKEDDYTIEDDEEDEETVKTDVDITKDIETQFNDTSDKEESKGKKNAMDAVAKLGGGVYGTCDINEIAENVGKTMEKVKQERAERWLSGHPGIAGSVLNEFALGKYGMSFLPDNGLDTFADKTEVFKFSYDMWKTLDTTETNLDFSSDASGLKGLAENNVSIYSFSDDGTPQDMKYSESTQVKKEKAKEADEAVQKQKEEEEEEMFSIGEEEEEQGKKITQPEKPTTEPVQQKRSDIENPDSVIEGGPIYVLSGFKNYAGKNDGKDPTGSTGNEYALVPYTNLTAAIVGSKQGDVIYESSTGYAHVKKGQDPKTGNHTFVSIDTKSDNPPPGIAKMIPLLNIVTDVVKSGTHLMEDVSYDFRYSFGTPADIIKGTKFSPFQTAVVQPTEYITKPTDKSLSDVQNTSIKVSEGNVMVVGTKSEAQATNVQSQKTVQQPVCEIDDLTIFEPYFFGPTVPAAETLTRETQTVVDTPIAEDQEKLMQQTEVQEAKGQIAASALSGQSPKSNIETMLCGQAVEIYRDGTTIGMHLPFSVNAERLVPLISAGFSKELCESVVKLGEEIKSSTKGIRVKARSTIEFDTSYEDQ